MCVDIQERQGNPPWTSLVDQGRPSSDIGFNIGQSSDLSPAERRFLLNLMVVGLHQPPRCLASLLFYRL
jgi:hypothetical protein